MICVKKLTENSEAVNQEIASPEHVDHLKMLITGFCRIFSSIANDTFSSTVNKGEDMKVTLIQNNKKRSHTQLDSRKQVIAFQDRVITINIKEAQHPLKWEKQVIDKSSIMLKISTKSMHRVLVWEIGPANNTTRCSRLSKHRLFHAWHPSQLAINLSIDKSKWQIHVNNKSN